MSCYKSYLMASETWVVICEKCLMSISKVCGIAFFLTPCFDFLKTISLKQPRKVLGVTNYWLECNYYRNMLIYQENTDINTDNWYKLRAVNLRENSATVTVSRTQLILGKYRTPLICERPPKRLIQNNVNKKQATSTQILSKTHYKLPIAFLYIILTQPFVGINGLTTLLTALTWMNNKIFSS